MKYFIIAAFFLTSVLHGELKNDCLCEFSTTKKPIVKVFAEALYWRAIDEGFDYYTSFTDHSNWKNDQWNVGWRLSCWYTTPKLDFGAGIVGTQLKLETEEKGLDDCARRWGLNYETVDAVLDGTVPSRGSLFFSYFGGLRWANIKKSLYSKIEEGPTSESYPFIVVKVRDDKMHFKGVGPLAGATVDYKLCHSFGIFGSFSAGLLYGSYRVEGFSSDTFTNPDQVFSGSYHRDSSVTQLFADVVIGFRFEKEICRDHHVIFLFGLEHHRYFGLNRIEALGDLYFDGANLSLGVSF